MSAVAQPDWVSAHHGLDDIRATIQALPGCVESNVTEMGRTEDSWCVYAFYWEARLTIFGLRFFPQRRWLQVLCQAQPDGTVSYELYASDAPTLTPAWTGDRFADLLEQIKSL
jgi:hypothetical protein